MSYREPILLLWRWRLDGKTLKHRKLQKKEAFKLFYHNILYSDWKLGEAFREKGERHLTLMWSSATVSVSPPNISSVDEITLKAIKFISPGSFLTHSLNTLWLSLRFNSHIKFLQNHNPTSIDLRTSSVVQPVNETHHLDGASRRRLLWCSLEYLLLS